MNAQWTATRGRAPDTRRKTRRRAAAIVSAALVVAAGAAYWTLENPPMDTIELAPPTADQLEAAAHARVFFGHQSVGANVLGGIEPLYADAGEAPPPVVDAGALPDDGPFVSHAFVGVNGDPLGKLEAFSDIVNGPVGERIDVALLKFCYVDVTAATDVTALFDAYADTIDTLAQRHPDIRFLYATVPLTTDRSWKANLKALIGNDDQAGPADNLARQRYNELVRQRYGDSGRLFDIAAIEATLAQHPTSRTSGDAEYFVLNRTLAADNGHLNALGARAAASELVRVIAANSGG